MSRFIYLGILLPLLIPPLVFSICAIAAGLSPDETLSATLEQFKAERQNLLICGAIGLFPVLLLLGALWIYRRAGGSAQTRLAMARVGLITIILVLIWVNFQFWPLFLPSRTYPGFPHGLELIIGPIFFAPAAMLAGMVVVWLFYRLH